MKFLFSKVKFKRNETDNRLVAEGEITNNSGRSYNTVVFRLVVFVREIPIGNITFSIKNFRVGQTRNFAKEVEELDYNMISKITRYEVFTESAY
ncbi:MAG: hypothetical protein N2Z79_00620 [Candidatus Omnitrophica bacterium]|nr:hypothetical protein [Candidatus Omnitrophota bacterium]